MIITKNVDQNKGIVNATCGTVRRWEDIAASLEEELDEIDVKRKRPAWVEVELTTSKGKDITLKLQPFEEKSLWVPYCRGVAVSGAYVVKQWPFMVAARMTVHRVQGVGIERVAVWIPSRNFFAEGQGYPAVSKGKTLDGLFLVLPDKVLQDRASAKKFLKETFQPPIDDAVNALSDMRRKAPATVTVNIRDGRVAYATLWDERHPYHAPSEWTSVWPEVLCNNNIAVVPGGSRRSTQLPSRLLPDGNDGRRPITLTPKHASHHALRHNTDRRTNTL